VNILNLFTKKRLILAHFRGETLGLF